LRSSLVSELKEARLVAGVSQRHLAGATGLSQSMISRTERDVRAGLTIEELAIHAEVLGLRLHVRAYPAGSPVRDAAQLRLLARFRGCVGDGFRWRTEVPVTAGGDLRAWDVLLDGPGIVGIEAESRLHDIQATQRRVELKLRDGQAAVVILLVAETRHNRVVLGQHRAALLSTFPLSTGEVLKALRQGEMPTQSGIVVL
jgi:transcriptional regulator with XRE-family HTH domain